MVECEYCKKKLDLPFQCPFCDKYFCKDHLPPHKHYCTSISKQDMISEVIQKTTLSKTLLDSFLFVTMMFIYAFIMGVAVLAVDTVVLLLLNLWNVGTWLTLLWVEGGIMMWIGGAAGLYHRKAPVFWTTPLGTRLYRIAWAVRRPWFWASFGIAGLMLIISATLVYWISS